eukprot:TRINITY_DN8483_c0_g2_i1.p1 TRINITY_DN8483_c0_g2~~TRINITY_DN8483_c0_g2_i1.p1  ORF type:complete len:150 (+),score=51.53 TRINITY_DN8483_c0_g2_i1:26-475(+)
MQEPPPPVSGLDKNIVSGDGEGLNYSFGAASKSAPLAADEMLLDEKAVNLMLEVISQKHQLTADSSELVELMSHATEERLRNLLERLAQLCMHRKRGRDGQALVIEKQDLVMALEQECHPLCAGVLYRLSANLGNAATHDAAAGEQGTT